MTLPGGVRRESTDGVSRIYETAASAGHAWLRRTGTGSCYAARRKFLPATFEGSDHIGTARWYLPCCHVIANSVSEKVEGDGAMLQQFPRARAWGASIAFALLVIAGGCARVTPHLELPHLQTRQPAFAATLGGYSA